MIPQEERIIKQPYHTASSDPGKLSDWKELAETLLAQNQAAQALSTCEQAKQALPREPDLWVLSATALGRLNRIEEAERDLVKALELCPESIAANYMLGALMQSQSRTKQALHHYQRVLSSDPDHVDSLCNMGVILLSWQRYSSAAPCFRRCIELKKDHLLARYNLALLQRNTGDTASALEGFRDILKDNPGFEAAITSEAEILMLNGHGQKAIDRIAPLLEAGSVTADTAALYADLSIKYGQPDQAYRLITSLLAQPRISKDACISLHFAAGRLNDRLSRYETAFHHFRAGNTLRFIPEAAAREIRRLAAIEEVFSREFLERAPRSGAVSDTPVFIVGMPRSGTSLVEQILATHPSVFGAGELRFINQIAGSLASKLHSNGHYPYCLESVDQQTLDECASDYLSRINRLAPDAIRISDKMPTNFSQLGLIELLFPGARVIHCVRDPADTCLSCYMQAFTGQHRYADSLSTLGGYYNRYRQLMAHWKRVLRIPVLDIHYERLVKDPEQEIRSLLEFCGLDWDRRCLDFHTNPRVTNTASFDQVRRPLYSSSIGKWQHYQPFLEPLFESLAHD